MDPQFIVGGLATAIVGLSGVILRLLLLQCQKMEADRDFWRERALREVRQGRRAARKFVDGEAGTPEGTPRGMA